MEKSTRDGLEDLSFLSRRQAILPVALMMLGACGGSDSAEENPSDVGILDTNQFTTSTCDQAEFEVHCETLRLINVEREKEGLPPYLLETVLLSAAQDHADDMDRNDYFDHVSKDGRSFFDRSIDAGYAGVPTAENIAAGATTPAQVVEMWMGSDGHRANILADRSNEIGIGYAPASNKWVLKFGTG